MKICVATGTRAEYGLLRPLLELMSKDNYFDLKILVTGAHLSPEFGLTYKSILDDGFIINETVEMLLSSDTEVGITKSMGLGMIGYADSLKKLSPDALIILGDRYEMLALASAALIFKIPIIHIHGGEITEGAYDDAIRHSITKMSQIHFPSTEEHRRRIIQLGENPEKVFNVGALGIDNIRKLKLLSRQEIEESLGVKLKKYNFQITFHPSTLDNSNPSLQFRVLLESLLKLNDSFFIFTKANADSHGRSINSDIDNFVKEYPEISNSFTSLGTLKFLSLVKICDAIVGNSSSGLIEAPSLNTPTINIGMRQKGRMQANSVINVGINEKEIINAFQKVITTEFKEQAFKTPNPYGEGNAAVQIISRLKKIDFRSLQIKSFYDVKYK